MKIFSIIVFGVLLITMFSVSCKKDTLESTVSQVDSTVVQERLHQFDPETQTFNVSSFKSTTITGKNGIVIHVPANAFTDDKGNLVNGTITIELKEMLTLRDQLTTGYHATAQHKTLKSYGAFYLSAQSGGQYLTLADSQYITVDVPALSIDSNTNVFIGNELGAFKTAEPFDLAMALIFTKLIKDTMGWDTLSNSWDIDSTYVDAYNLSFGVNKYVVKTRDLYYSNLFYVCRFVNPSPVFPSLPCTINAGNGANQEVIDYSVHIMYQQYGSVGWGDTKGVVTNSIVVDVNEEWATGEDVVVVVIGVGKTSKKNYFGKTNFKIATDSKPVINIAPMSNEELSAALDNL